MGNHRSYLGHKNWNHWNVSLWIQNDYGLYVMARDHIATAENRDTAARLILEDLVSQGVKRTPDGAPYSISTIRHAIVGLS